MKNRGAGFISVKYQGCSSLYSRYRVGGGMLHSRPINWIYIYEYMKSYIRNRIKCIGEIKCYNPGIIFQKTELDGTFHCLNWSRILAMITDHKSWFLLNLAVHNSLLASNLQGEEDLLVFGTLRNNDIFLNHFLFRIGTQDLISNKTFQLKLNGSSLYII